MTALSDFVKTKNGADTKLIGAIAVGNTTASLTFTPAAAAVVVNINWYVGGGGGQVTVNGAQIVIGTAGFQGAGSTSVFVQVGETLTVTISSTGGSANAAVVVSSCIL